MTAIHADLKAAVEVETHAYLWTPSDGVDFTPRVCDKIFGDGRALLRLTTINSRPRFYVIRIDSAWKVDDSGAPVGRPDIWDHLEEIYEALEEQFGCVREIEDDADDELNGWPAFDHETGASWSRMDWPVLPGVRLEPHPYAGHFTILGVDHALQRERAKLVYVLSAWRVEKEENERQMENLVAVYAANNGLKLIRRELASPDEVMTVVCPRHGAGPCWDLRGSALRRGCLTRQIEALRSDYLPPRVEAAGGGTGEDGCE